MCWDYWGEVEAVVDEAAQGVLSCSSLRWFMTRAGSPRLVRRFGADHPGEDVGAFFGDEAIEARPRRAVLQRCFRPDGSRRQNEWPSLVTADFSSATAIRRGWVSTENWINYRNRDRRRWSDFTTFSSSNFGCW